MILRTVPRGAGIPQVNPVRVLAQDEGPSAPAPPQGVRRASSTRPQPASTRPVDGRGAALMTARRRSGGSVYSQRTGTPYPEPGAEIMRSATMSGSYRAAEPYTHVTHARGFPIPPRIERYTVDALIRYYLVRVRTRVLV